MIWKITHGDANKYLGPNELEDKLNTCAWGYVHECNFLYSDDVGEYSHDRWLARGELNKMKLYIDENYTGEISAEKFKQFFDSRRYRIIAIKVEGLEMVTYLDEREYVARVKFQIETAEEVDEIIKYLSKIKSFKHDGDYFIAQEISEEERINKISAYARDLYEGHGYERNYGLAYLIFKYLADELGEPDALYYMGLYYQDGYDVVKKDIKTAIEYYEKALAKGDKKYSANNLGVIYATGNGVPKDEKKALKYYETAMGAGDIYAMASVAKIYEEGKVVERDRLKAWQLYDKAWGHLWNENVSWEFREELKKDIKRLEEELR